MKFVLIIDDEAWFWVFNDETHHWECSYENGDEPAERADKLDRATIGAVTEIMMWMGHDMHAFMHRRVAESPTTCDADLVQ